MTKTYIPTLKKIEEDLAKIIQKDKASWVELYRLMQQVQDEKLWQEAGHQSFTVWVRALAITNHIHESLLWKRKNAGSIYAGYQERAAVQGRRTVPMEALNVSPDNFELVKKIAQGNLKEQDELIDKVVDQSITRKDLKSTWQTVQALRESQGISATKKNHHDNQEKNEQTKLKEPELDAAQVAISLNQRNWLSETFGTLYEQSQKNSRRIFRSLAELPVYTGTSSYSRRIDLLIIENMTQEEAYQLNLHAIEIKVSRSDLLHDQKMSEYTDFVDYFWLAVPETLQADAETQLLPEWGLLVIDSNNHMQVKQKPNRLKPNKKEATLQTALLKVLN